MAISTIDLSQQERFHKLKEASYKYDIQAYYFILYCVEKISSIAKGHVTGEQLCRFISKELKDLVGFCALDLLNEWKIKNTRDFGVIVWDLVQIGMLGRTEKDSIDDFNDIYDFSDEFDVNKLF